MLKDNLSKIEPNGGEKHMKGKTNKRGCPRMTNVGLD